jgi:hypothetical protein
MYLLARLRHNARQPARKPFITSIDAGGHTGRSGPHNHHVIAVVIGLGLQLQGRGNFPSCRRLTEKLSVNTYAWTIRVVGEAGQHTLRVDISINPLVRNTVR